MNISAKGRYGLRLMMDVAEQGEGTPIKVKDISRRQNIPEKYCEQIVSALVKAKLLFSVRGAQGGYYLNGDPRDITALDILSATEGNIDFTSEEASFSSIRGEIATEVLFKKLTDSVMDILKNVTIEDLISWQPGSGDDYII